ncbi:kinetochore complex Sim4 subunit Fta1-domain-containing protein [Staphylotrichum tortipilum]|uniref:Kinetochore complex Sim4 subunit Fta1-domain-containing protein n=1 Tax=Staphylotrichum tortipilum TaxID=2831512 RepID=A0AAN6MP37_9PEZI|nr:kinetochore complex Sim4 subunit Fta1-domain-containing protein [Staphylotrichum longicolle]
MPPKRRRPPAPEPESPRQASPAPEHDQFAAEDEEDDDANGVTGQSRPPFYNTTFSAHRISPLYLGSEPLTANRLQILAQRLRDKLVGDVVRGVEVRPVADSDDTILGRAGALEKVEIHWAAVPDVLDISAEDIQSVRESGEGEEGEEAGQEQGVATHWRRVAAQLPTQKALHISLRFELASCTALMLPPLNPDEKDGAGAADAAARTRFSVAGGRSTDDMDWEQTVNPAHFLSLPLLLLRMPVPLKAMVGDFLATTFDCRVSPIRLGTRSLVRSWEAWIRSAGLPPRGPLAKDAVLSLGFYLAPPPVNQPSEQDNAIADQEEELQPPGLRSIDVIIPAAELQKFVSAGKRVTKTQSKQTNPTAGWGWESDLKQRRLLAGRRLGEEGWEWRLSVGQDQATSSSQPFTEALACYLKEHLGLNLFHPGVRVTKIACGGFAMSEMRLKMFAPADAGATQGSGSSLLGQRGAVLELLGGLVEKAQSQALVG